MSESPHLDYAQLTGFDQLIHASAEQKRAALLNQLEQGILIPVAGRKLVMKSNTKEIFRVINEQGDRAKKDVYEVALWDEQNSKQNKLLYVQADIQPGQTIATDMDKRYMGWAPAEIKSKGLITYASSLLYSWLANQGATEVVGIIHKDNRSSIRTQLKIQDLATSSFYPVSVTEDTDPDEVDPHYVFTTFISDRVPRWEQPMSLADALALNPVSMRTRRILH
jgi:hypothetical protein